MDEYPNNSHKSKQQRNETVQGESVESKKKQERITETDVVRRKKPLGKRVVEHFAGVDARGVISFVTQDVLLPSARETIADAVSQGIEKLVFGESRSTPRRGSRYGAGRNDYTPYNRMGSHGSRRDPVERVSDPRRRARANHNFDEFVIGTRVEAEEVIERLYDLVQQYESASVAQLYDLLGVESQFTDQKWGWFSLSGAKIDRIRDGYVLDLPRPEPLD